MQHPAKRQKFENQTVESLYSNWGMWYCPGIGCFELRYTHNAIASEIEPEMCATCHNRTHALVRDIYRDSLSEKLPANEVGLASFYMAARHYRVLN